MSRILCLIPALVCVAAFGQTPADYFEPFITEYEGAAPAPLLDRMRFLARSPVTRAALSPDGRHIAYGIRDGLKTSLFLMDTNSDAKRLLLGKLDLRDINWTADSDRLILDLGESVGIVPVTGKHAGYITTLDLENGDSFIGPAHALAESILVLRRTPERAYRLEWYSPDGEREVLLTTGRKIREAMVSKDGRIAIVMTEEAEGPVISRIRDGKLEKLLTCTIPAGPFDRCDVISVDGDNNRLWLTTNVNDNFNNLNTLSLSSGELTIMHRDPGGIADIRSWSLQHDMPAVLRYHRGKLVNYALDAQTQAHIDYLESLFPESNITPEPNENGDTWLVTQGGDQYMIARYFLYDAATGEIRQILEQESETGETIAPGDLSQKIPFSFTASDGMTIHAFVSFPRGVDLSRAPMIAQIHGGPFGMVDTLYTWNSAFLVNRGYIVYEPNFRVSAGYGKDYIARGNRDFGNGVIQQDIIDGLEFLLARGIGQRDRLGITGGSFGGFAVLTGLAYTPDLFKGGFAVVPPADITAALVYQLEARDPYEENPMSAARARYYFGDYEDPAYRQRLFEQSPQASVPTITAPLAMMAAGSDRNVPINNVKQFSLELLNQGKAFSLLVDENLDHGGWPDFESAALLSQLESFFALTLDGRRQDTHDPALRAYLQDSMQINTIEGYAPGAP